jgi:hypothetical protein
MRKIFFLLILIYSVSSFAQISDTLFISKLANLSWTKSYKNYTKFKFVKFVDGTVLQVGDTMKLGRPSSINQTSEQTPDIFQPTLQSVNVFSYIILGRIEKLTLSGIAFLPETFKGKEIEIKQIKLVKTGKIKTKISANLVFNNSGIDITVLNVDSALQYSELINPKAVMTSEKAFVALKEAKTKLDLGVITQEQYDSIKKELVKIIK